MMTTIQIYTFSHEKNNKNWSVDRVWYSACTQKPNLSTEEKFPLKRDQNWCYTACLYQFHASVYILRGIRWTIWSAEYHIHDYEHRRNLGERILCITGDFLFTKRRMTFYTWFKVRTIIAKHQPVVRTVFPFPSESRITPTISIIIFITSGQSLFQ